MQLTTKILTCLSATALLTNTAAAVDSNGDGCEDSYFNANGACVSPDASVDPSATIGAGAIVGAGAVVGRDMVVGAGAVVGSRTTLTGSSASGNPYNTGTDTVIGRAVSVGADVSMANDVTVGRSSDLGAGTTLQTGSSLGYAVSTGTDVTVGANATVGSLVSLGNYAQVASGAVLARGVVITDSDSSGAATSIEGIVGPEVSIGKNVSIASGVRIRKNTTIGDNTTIATGARIGRDVVIESGVTIGSNARIQAASTLQSGVVVEADGWVPHGTTIERVDINPPGTTLIASSAYVDPSPPSGWTQCAGFTNTSGNDVSAGVFDGCLPFTKLRLRLYNASGVLVDDIYGSGMSVSSFPSAGYITSGRTNVLSNNYPGTAGLYAGNPHGGTAYHPMFSTGNGGPSMVPNHPTHSNEIAVGSSSINTPLLGYTMAVFH